MHRECAQDHYQVDKARAIRDEDRMTERSNFSRVCEKCGLRIWNFVLLYSSRNSATLDGFLFDADDSCALANKK